MTYLGVDAGGTLIKAGVYNSSGALLGLGASSASISRPHPGYAERSAEDIWDSAVISISRALSAWGGDVQQIEAVCIIGHSDGLYAIDARGRPVGAAIQPTDSRSTGYVDTWRKVRGAEQVLELAGHLPFAGSAVSLLKWIERHEPDEFSSIHTLFSCKDWLRFRLTGHVGTDPTDASGSFVDVHTGAYSDELLSLLGMRHIKRMLPPIFPSRDIVGEVLPEAADQTGLRLGTPVVCGAHDVDGAAISLGATDEGRLSVIAGTFSINQVVARRVAVSPAWQARPFVEPDRWLLMATSPVSTSNFDWALDVLGVQGSDRYSAASELALTRLQSPQRPYFLPFLFGTPTDTRATAGFHDLLPVHERADLLASVLEGLCFNHKMHCDELTSARLVSGAGSLAGGASRNPLFCQLLADVLDREITVTDHDEIGVRGAAMLAASSVCDQELASIYSSWRTPSASYWPSPSMTEVLAERFERYAALCRSGA